MHAHAYISLHEIKKICGFCGGDFLFACVIGISLWNFLAPGNFNILWRWFAWSNQVLAAISLWVSTAYLYHNAANKWRSLFTAVPALFMTAIVVTYILAEPELALGRFIPYNVALSVGVGVAVLIAVFYLAKVIRRKGQAEK